MYLLSTKRYREVIKNHVNTCVRKIKEYRQNYITQLREERQS